MQYCTSDYMFHWHHLVFHAQQTNGSWLEVATFLVGIISLLIIYLQLRLMSRQDEIIGRQAILTPRVEYTDENQFAFDVQNVGRRGVRNFDWHIWVPKELGTNLQINNIYSPNNGPVGEQTIEGKEFFHFKGRFADEIYPTRAKRFAILDLLQPVEGDFIFYWQIACEDGVFPEQIEQGPLRLTVNK